MVETIQKTKNETNTLDEFLRDHSCRSEILPAGSIPGKSIDPSEKIKEKVSSGRLSNKREFERQYLEELQGSVSQDFTTPSYLIPYINYTPNEEFAIHGGSVRVKTYGIFQGELFGKKHITRENIDRVLAIHDASHSVAMFLKHIEGSSCGIDFFFLLMIQ